MELAPVAIQVSLVLLGIALSQYLWGLDRLISSVVIGFTSLGLALYIAFVATSVISFDCPFQTPLSLSIHHITREVGPWLERWWWQNTENNLKETFKSTLPNFAALGQGLNIHMNRSSLSPIWKKGYDLDANCITRMLVLSTDEDTIRVAMDFAQDIPWHADVKGVPLKEIYSTLISCFGFTHDGTPTLNPRLRDLAYLSAKTFVYIHVQQHCTPQATGTSWHPDELHRSLGHRASGDDPDLNSALLMLDKALGYNVKVIGNDFQPLDPAHHLWMSHLFVYYAQQNPLSDEVSAFVQRSLDLEQSLDRAAVVTDCLYMIGILLGIPPGDETITKWDKRLDRLALFHCPDTDLCQVTRWALWSIEFFRSSQVTSPGIRPRPKQITPSGRFVHYGS
jgi:hypothetical protein